MISPLFWTLDPVQETKVRAGGRLYFKGGPTPPHLGVGGQRGSLSGLRTPGVAKGVYGTHPVIWGGGLIWTLGQRDPW